MEQVTPTSFPSFHFTLTVCMQFVSPMEVTADWRNDFRGGHEDTSGERANSTVDNHKWENYRHSLVINGAICTGTCSKLKKWRSMGYVHVGLSYLHGRRGWDVKMSLLPCGQDNHGISSARCRFDDSDARKWGGEWGWLTELRRWLDLFLNISKE